MLFNADPAMLYAFLQMRGGAHVMIDYEHSGVADAVPPFQSLNHYPPGCQEENKLYVCTAYTGLPLTCTVLAI